MFGISFSNIIIIILVMIVFIRPDDMPKFLRTVGRFYGKAKKMYNEIIQVKDRIVREIDDVTKGLDDVTKEVDETAKGIDAMTKEISKAANEVQKAAALEDAPKTDQKSLSQNVTVEEKPVQTAVKQEGETKTPVH